MLSLSKHLYRATNPIERVRTAADMLRQPTGLTKPRIIKQRTSELRRQRSHYFHEPKDIQVLDSETRVMETSPEPQVDYTNFSTRNVLRQGSDAVWTSSQSIPRAPMDLKSLTRSVSREHGTLAQSVRRRPSLPFQSPTKVR